MTTKDDRPRRGGTGAEIRPLAWRLWRDWARRYWRPLAGALCLMAVFAASEGAIALYLERVLGWMTDPGGGALAAAVGVILALGGANAAALFFQTRLTNSVALRVIEDIQNAMFAHVSAMDFARLSAEAPGKLAARFVNDATVMREMLVRAPNGLVRDVLRIIALAAVMAVLDWVLFLSVLVIYPLASWPIGRAGARVRQVSRAAQAQMGI